MRWVIFLVVLSALLSGTAFLGYYAGASKRGGDTSIWSSGPTVKHIESMGQLVSTRITIHDVLEAKSDTHRGSWLIRGDALTAIDLTKAKILSSDKEAHTAKIQIPPPKVLSARVDHEKSMTWRIEKTSWVPWRNDDSPLRDMAMKHAQRLVEHAANSKENIDNAKDHAIKVITNIYKLVGWEVEVEWESDGKNAPAGGGAA